VPVYKASQQLVRALMAEVYGPEQVERVYEWACDPGELPRLSEVQRLLEAEAKQTKEERVHQLAIAFDLRNIDKYAITEQDLRRANGDELVDMAVALRAGGPVAR
jgi:hypothetical protein